MDSEIINTFNVTEAKAQYDACAKRLLSEKHVLSHILIRTVDEFKGMNPNYVIEKIEGEPYIGSVPIEPGLTNKAEGERVVGFNTEDSEINEGLVRFDIVFYVRTNDDFRRLSSTLRRRRTSRKNIICSIVRYTMWLGLFPRKRSAILLTRTTTKSSRSTQFGFA